MEESNEVHTDENKTHPEKKQKRIVKTRAQVEALENFYNENKYPTEAMKLELAESIGLTEKQVSGWFCHRRLKDKKSPNDEVHTHGKQDRSSGVIQDRGSGLRQDSCGSTKQGDNRHCELKEVESRRFTTTSLLPIDNRYDDTSSGSSSSLKDTFAPQNVDHLGVASSKYTIHNDAKSVKGRTGPSGYLKVKGQVEDAAITAVKRQLGRHYREDGPPLGIEFEPLPPGAFENPVKVPVNQSYYVGDRTALRSLDGSTPLQQPNSNKMYERYNSRIYHPSDLDETGLKIRHGSKHRDKYSEHPYKKTPLHNNPFPLRDSEMELNEDSMEETSAQDLRDHFEMRKNHARGVKRHDSLSNHHLTPYGHTFAVPKVTQREYIEPISDLIIKQREFVELDRGLSRNSPKDDKLYEERRGVDEYPGVIPVKIHSRNEMRVKKRSSDEFMPQGYPPRKESVVEVPPWTNKTKRSTAEMPSSFSEDETAETGSSGD